MIVRRASVRAARCKTCTSTHLLANATMASTVVTSTSSSTSCGPVECTYCTLQFNCYHHRTGICTVHVDLSFNTQFSTICIVRACTCTCTSTLRRNVHVGTCTCTCTCKFLFTCAYSYLWSSRSLRARPFGLFALCTCTFGLLALCVLVPLV